jgi:hypothetical protein
MSSRESGQGCEELEVAKLGSLGEIGVFVNRRVYFVIFGFEM